MKRWMIPVFFLLAIGFISAQQGGLGELLDLVNESTLILSAIFIISFSVLFFSLNKFFKSNPLVSGAVSLAIALLITYWVNKTGFTIDIQGWFSGIGISEEMLLTIIPIIILAGAVLLIIKLKTKALLVFGGLFILLGLLAEEGLALIIAGIVVLVIGFALSKKKEKGLKITTS
jgi:hypothetical protein